MITGAFAVLLWRRFRQLNLRPVLWVFLVPIFVSVAWFEVFRNHSQHHHWFTYRSASFALVCPRRVCDLQSYTTSGKARDQLAGPGLLWALATAILPFEQRNEEAIPFGDYSVVRILSDGYEFNIIESFL